MKVIRIYLLALSLLISFIFDIKATYSETEKEVDGWLNISSHSDSKQVVHNQPLNDLADTATSSQVMSILQSQNAKKVKVKAAGKKVTEEGKNEDILVEEVCRIKHTPC